MQFKAFAALRPRPELAAKVASVPYDVVNRSEAAALAKGNAVSFLHVGRPDIDVPDDVSAYDDRVYAKGRENLDRFADDGTLMREDRPTVYVYRQVMNGRSQTGIVGCVHIDDYEKDIIKKHERTRRDKEDDRTRHVLELNANAEPVLLAFRDEAKLGQLIAEVSSGTPLYDFTSDDGVQHTIWSTDDVDRFESAFGSVPFSYVADGHHRCASAWRAGKELKAKAGRVSGDEEFHWFLAVLFPASELSILAYNRVVADLNGLSVEEFVGQLRTVGEVTENVDPTPTQAGSFCVYVDGRWYGVKIHDRLIDGSDPIGSLDAALLESLVLGPILGVGDIRSDPRVDFVGGIRGTGELERRVDSGEMAIGFSMFPTSMEQLMAVADAGQIMPPKSTWFEPKLRSGLLVHTLD